MGSIQKIWYQSFVDPNKQKNYIEQLQAYLNNCASEGFVFEVHGLTPPDTNLHPLTEFRCAAQTIKNAIEAEKQGYDAFVIGHFQEPGLNEIKALLDIPVIGLGEHSMLHACTLGYKIGLVTINPVFIPWHENQIRYYGLQQRVVAVSAVNVQVRDFEQAFIDATAYQKMLHDFTQQTKPIVEQGVEVILFSGGLPMLLFTKENNFMIDGAVVVNGIAVAAQSAEMALRLIALNGGFISRRGMYKKATVETVNEFLTVFK